MTTDTIFAITLVTGPGAAEHAATLPGRVVTDADDLQHGDVLVGDTALNWIASNVILLDDGRAPIVRRVEMAG